MQVMRVLLGETSTRFRPGPDGGRDGWYQGTAAGKLVSETGMNGNVVVQCKHTSKTHEPLELSGIKKELLKLKSLAAERPCHYILMTNRQVTAPAEKEIREAVEAIPGAGKCLILSETWIEDTVDGHPRLLRLVPRLYGIGDLSQIVSFVLQEQTRAILADLAEPLRTFVPTDSYRRAEHALNDHRFVVLVGPPASGKTAIAANLCMVTLAQNANIRVMRIEEAEQFKNTWSPADEHTVYWVDDVFGETTLDETRLREWSQALEKVEAARKRGARIIFCTRDYILTSALDKLKRSKAEHIADARVVVNVTELSWSEREAILYNHIKDGNISAGQKKELKQHLPSVARFPSFTPELARRLGNKRFHHFKRSDLNTLRDFFEKPVEHFRDVIHGLSNAETAALAVCLHSGNSLPDPVPATSISESVLQTFDVTLGEVRTSLERLEGSFVKRVRSANHQTWQFHHPSMLEALQKEIAERSAQLLLYLESAELHILLRDTTTVAPPAESRLVFIPEAAYGALAVRFHGQLYAGAIARYLGERASPPFLHYMDRFDPSIIDRALQVYSEPEDSNEAMSFGAKLAQVGVLLDDRRRAILRSTLQDGVDDAGYLGFLEVDGLERVFPGFARETLEADRESGFSSVERTYDWYAQDLSSLDHIDGALDGLHVHCERLLKAIARFVGDPAPVSDLIAQRQKHFDEKLIEERAEKEEAEGQRADHDYDAWKERHYDDKRELEHGRFSDVDE